MDSKDLKKRTKQFAHQCVRFAQNLPTDRVGNHIHGQLIRASTSVAAYYRAACLAQSKRSYIAKLSIVIEEVDESEFWLEFSLDENLCSKNICVELMDEARQLTSIFIASRKTASENLDK